MTWTSKSSNGQLLEGSLILPGSSPWTESGKHTSHNETKGDGKVASIRDVKIKETDARRIRLISRIQ